MSVEDSPRIFVGGLKREVEKWEVEQVFAPYGDVKDVWIARDPPGYAFVEFETVECAKIAMDELNNTENLDTIIRIERTKAKPKENSGRGGDREWRSGGRGGGGRGGSRGRGRGGGRPRGRSRGRGHRGGYQAFIDDSNPSYHDSNFPPPFDPYYDEPLFETEYPPEEEHGDGYDGYEEEEEEEERPRLYVGNLGEDVTKDQLMEVFSPFGEVVDVWIARSPKGFAFVQFSELYDAKRALKELDGTEHYGSTYKIEITHNKSRKRSAMAALGPPRPPFPARGRPRGRRPLPRSTFPRRARVLRGRPPPYYAHEDPYYGRPPPHDPYYPPPAADKDYYAPHAPAARPHEYEETAYEGEYPPPTRRARPRAADPYAPPADAYADPAYPPPLEEADPYAAPPPPPASTPPDPRYPPRARDPYHPAPARAAADPYGAPDPYAAPARPTADPYAAPARPAADPYDAHPRPATDPHAPPPRSSADPYAAPARAAADPYAAPARPAADPYAAPARPAADPYAAPARPAADPYAAPARPAADPYAAPARPAASPHGHPPRSSASPRALPPRSSADPYAPPPRPYDARAAGHDSHVPPPPPRREAYPYRDSYAAPDARANPKEAAVRDPAVPYVAPVRPAAERANGAAEAKAPDTLEDPAVTPIYRE